MTKKSSLKTRRFSPIVDYHGDLMEFLKDEECALEYLNRALELDPSFEEAIDLGEMIAKDL